MGFHHDGLDIFYNKNLFGHATLKESFTVLNLNDRHNDISTTFVSYFDFDSKSIKWHAQLGCVAGDKMSRLVKKGLIF